MKAFTTIFASVLLLFFASCSSESDALLPTDTNNPEILQELSQSEWKLISCPDHEYLSINGYSECNYLAKLSFENEKVYITHKNSSYKMPHHICYVMGSTLVVSVQDCANTTWKSTFEWLIIDRNSSSMILEVTVPNLSPSYRERFTFEKLR